MKKLLLLLTVLLLPFVYADLSDFPDNFMVGSRFNALIVVGAQGSSTDVLSQNKLGLTIAQHVGQAQLNIYALDSDTDLEGNRILIGNPCVNALAAELLGDPDPCDSAYPAGSPSVRFIEESGFMYIVAAGQSDQGTRMAVDALLSFELTGTEHIIGMEDEEEVERPPLRKDSTEEEEIPEPEVFEEVEADTAPPEPREVDIPEREATEDVVVVKEKGFFRKLWEWFTGLFT